MKVIKVSKAKRFTIVNWIKMRFKTIKTETTGGKNKREKISDTVSGQLIGKRDANCSSKMARVLVAARLWHDLRMFHTFRTVFYVAHVRCLLLMRAHYFLTCLICYRILTYKNVNALLIFV